MGTYKFVYMCMVVCRYLCTGMGKPKVNVRCLLSASLLYFLSQELSLNLKLTVVRVAMQKNPEICWFYPLCARVAGVHHQTCLKYDIGVQIQVPVLVWQVPYQLNHRPRWTTFGCFNFSWESESGHVFKVCWLFYSDFILLFDIWQESQLERGYLSWRVPSIRLVCGHVYWAF